jgi:hypothetical protein
MDPSLSNPFADSFLGYTPMGAIYVRCLLVVFVALVCLYALYQFWRVRRGLRLLDEAAKIHRAKDTSYNTVRDQNGSSGLWR